MALAPLSAFGRPIRYWTLSSTQNYRHFIQIRDEGVERKVIELEQERGDFPQILNSTDFENRAQLATFLTRFQSQKISESSHLENWPIENSLNLTTTKSSTHRKFLGFGHHNKNLWPTLHQWDEQWEEKFAKWIEKNVKEDFFQKYGISTDCADAVLGVRWIFSRINGLPVGNHISVSNSLFTNYSVPRDWRKIPKAQNWYDDQLFRTALSYVMDLASTRTLKNDAYPVALTKKGLRVGSFILTESKESNHVKLVSENHYDDPTDLPLFTLASTVPRKVRLLVREVVTDQGWPVENEKSFLKYRWPIDQDGKITLKSSESHQDYSLEQYSLELREQYPIFIEFLLGRLKKTYDPKKLISMALEDIVDYIKQRIIVVNEGAAFCASHDCSPGSENWDAWSTPSRDEKLKAKFANIDLLTSQFEDISPGLIQKWRDAQLETRVGILEYSLNLKTIRYLLESGKASSDPAVSAQERWGIDLSASSQDLISSTLELLQQRKEIIESQREACSIVDCFPKTPKWLSWNTYKVDEKLLGKYREFQEFCEIYGPDICLDVILNQAPTFDSGTENLDLKEWIQRIPYFYSNLDVSKERRWGKVGTLTHRLLKYKKSISFSNVGSALIDSRELIDLKSGKLLYQASAEEHLCLAKSGDLLVQNGIHMRLAKVVQGTISQSMINLAPFVPVPGMKGEASSIATHDKFIELVFAGEDGRKTFAAIYGAKGELLYGPGLALVSNDKALTLLPNNSILFSADKGVIIEVTRYAKVLATKKMRLDHFTPVAMEEEKILFLYEDENYGVFYPVLFKKDAVMSLGVKQIKNVKLKYFNLSEEVFFLDYLVTEEYPKALVATVVDQNPKYVEVGNSFFQVREYEKVIYFSTLTGSAWEQGRVPNFKKLEAGVISTFDKPDLNTELSHFGRNGFFSRGKDVYTRGSFLAYDGTQPVAQVAYPSFLRSDEELCANAYASKISYVEQLNYQHGDYSCFGTVYKDESKDRPIYSLKFRTDKNIFNTLTNYQNKNLELLGPGLLIWWGKKYNQ